MLLSYPIPSSPVLSSPIPSCPKESSPHPHKKTRDAYGSFGWVKLSHEEYHRLLNDLGEAELKRCIDYVDESAQATDNKNKWRDWNLVLRKCSRDCWGLDSQKPQQPSARQLDEDEILAIQRMLQDNN